MRGLQEDMQEWKEDRKTLIKNINMLACTSKEMPEDGLKLPPELCVVKVMNDFHPNFSKMVDTWWKLTKYIGSQWHNLLVLEKSWNYGMCKKTTTAH